LRTEPAVPSPAEVPAERPPRLLWRLTAVRHAQRAYTGEGARLYGGRWNHPGVPLVYTSLTLSLAALELFVHLDGDIAPDHLAARAAELPGDLAIPVLEIADLPGNWRTYPAPERLKDLGTAWARSGASLALSVPSAVVPRERNVLLSPAHPDFARLRVLPPEGFSFDPRMWKGK
jgi:RES domain-containing protein